MISNIQSFLCQALSTTAEASLGSLSHNDDDSYKNVS